MAEHGKLLWIVCYEDDYLIHLFKKNGVGYFSKEKDCPKEKEVRFNIMYRGLTDPTEPEDEEYSPDDWYKEEVATLILEVEAPSSEEEELLLPFEEREARLPEYLICANAQY